MGATDRFLKRGRIQDFSRGPIAKMLSELKKFGANGHLYIPGVGAISGITAGNYLDSIGTTNAGVDGNVGLVLDGAGSVGPELVANQADRELSSDTGFWSKHTGVTITNGSANFSSVIGGDGLYRSGFVTAQKAYLITLSVTVTSGTCRAYLQGAYGSPISATGTYSTVLQATANGLVGVFAQTAFTGSIDNISVKEITGIHASQATTGYQPKLRRGIVNLLTQSDFQNGLTDAHTRGGLITLSSIDAKNALAFGYDGATASYGYKAYSAAADSSNTVAVLVKMDSGNAPVFGSATPASPLNDFLLKASSSELPALTYTIASVGSGLYVVAATGVATGSQVGVVKYANNSTNTFKVTSYGLFQGTITAQQILAAGGIPLTTTAPASSTAGAYKCDFDGVDDKLGLGSVPFQITDDHYVASCSSTNSSANTNLFACYKDGASSAINLKVFGTLMGFWRDDAGTSIAISASGGLLALNQVYTGSIRHIAGSYSVTKNGGNKVSQAGAFGTTTFTNAAIGGLTAANFFSGSEYGMIVIKGAVSDAQDLIFQRGLNALSQYAAGRF